MSTNTDPETKNPSKEIKAVVWDLDGTLWDGVLLENDKVQLKPGIKKIIKTLDSRGILQSIASHNDFETAMAKLREQGLAEYFLFPEINWDAKSLSIQRIQESLNIGMDSLLFIDDRAFERDEVLHVHPEVTCIEASAYKSLLDCPALIPKFITQDSRRRRLMYIEDIQRKNQEKSFEGPRQEFLASLGIELGIAQAQEEDLQRAVELTTRTNQLNTTGLTFGYDELRGFIHSSDHSLLVCDMKDKYGSCGKIGLALIEISKKYWHLRLFLMSCRVLAYGVGMIVLSHIMQETKKARKKLRADFIDTGRNQQMYITFKFSNFRELETAKDGYIILENDLSFIQKIPSYVDLKIGS
jgi:FkbH-like protein